MDRQRVAEIAGQSKREKWPFPRTFEALKAAGVASYRFDVPSCETLFRDPQGSAVAEGIASAPRVEVAPALDPAAVAAAIRRHITEQTPFLDFRGEAARAGVLFWEVDMSRRTVTYCGEDGGQHVEEVPPWPS